MTSFKVGGIQIERILEMEIPFIAPGEAYPDAPDDAFYDGAQTKLAIAASVRSISSSVPGCGTRRWRSVDPTSATPARMSSTGWRVRPTSHQTTEASARTRIGIVTRSAPPSAMVLSPIGSDVVPTWRVPTPGK